MYTRTRFTAWKRGQGISSKPSQCVVFPRAVLKVTVGLVTLYQTCNQDFGLLRSNPRRCLTKPNQPMYNNGCDNQFHDYILSVNDVLSDDQGSQYLILDLLGTGTFGQVVKCRVQKTGEVVAVKVIKNQPAYFNQAWVEINILRMLHRNNCEEDTRHVVKFFTHFIFRGHLCLVFEKLSINLYDLLKQNSYVGVDLETLRSFVTQLLRTLRILVQSEVIHCDLKPENILLNSLDASEVKIIDFGSACQLHYPVYSYVQSRFYRSPEVLLGAAGYDSQIDMWSLGCVAAELFLGIPLFPGQNEMNMICRIVEMLGDMPDRFLRRCRETGKFFNSPGSSDYSADDMRVYQLKPNSQYEQENNIILPQWKRFFKEKKLKDIVMTYPHPPASACSQGAAIRECFVDLLLGMLRIDPRERWTPAEALQHPFILGQVLPANQPWCPPARHTRVMRSRPVFINPSNEEELTLVDEFYSASAPNFTAKGHLNVNTTWGTGAGGKPANVRRSNGMFQFYQQYHYHLPPLEGSAEHTRNRHSLGEEESPLTGKLSFAPGSYIPSSSSSRYGSSSNAQQRSSFDWARSASPIVGCSSLDQRRWLFPRSGLVESDDNQVMFRDSDESPLEFGEGDAWPVPQTRPLKLGCGVQNLESRDLRTVSLRLSGEPMQNSVVSPAGEVGEDAIFPFGSDDEPIITFHQGSLAASAFAVPEPMRQKPLGHSVQQQRQRLGNQTTAALPPPGPSMSHGRSSMTHRASTNVPSYGHAGHAVQAGGVLGAMGSSPFCNEVEQSTAGAGQFVNRGIRNRIGTLSADKMMQNAVETERIQEMVACDKPSRNTTGNGA